jgi:hypothetical protein
MRERPTLDWIPLVLLAALTFALRPHPAPASWATPGYSCVYVPASARLPATWETDPYEHVMDVVADALARADASYRRGDVAGAAELTDHLLPNGEYSGLHEQYAQLAAARAIALDPKSTAIDAFEALRRARTLDMALGGALADEQTRWMQTIAPRAARMYDDARDREGAALARHTAQMIE